MVKKNKWNLLWVVFIIITIIIMSGKGIFSEGGCF